MNGSSIAANLPNTGRTVRNKKYLDFSTLKNFLSTLTAGTEEQAQMQSSDNPEVGQSINLSSTAPGEKPIKLDVYTKTGQVFKRDRAQFQAVFYYKSGAAQVVTPTHN